MGVYYASVPEEVERRAVLVRAIEGINATLRGPGVPNLERLMLNADRHDLRAKLAELDGEA